MSFDNDPKDRKPKKGLNISNKASGVQQPKLANLAAFDEKATEIFEQQENYKSLIWDLSTKYKSFINDKTVPENKSLISKDIEKEVLDKLIGLASEMNEDINQPDGHGNVVLNMLLMKCMLIQRDMINSLSFKVDNLEKLSFKLSNELEKKQNKM